jgi:hypothetical protein
MYISIELGIEEEILFQCRKCVSEEDWNVKPAGSGSEPELPRE